MLGFMNNMFGSQQGPRYGQGMSRGRNPGNMASNMNRTLSQNPRQITGQRYTGGMQPGGNTGFTGGMPQQQGMNVGPSQNFLQSRGIMAQQGRPGMGAVQENLQQLPMAQNQGNINRLLDPSINWQQMMSGNTGFTGGMQERMNAGGISPLWQNMFS